MNIVTDRLRSRGAAASSSAYHKKFAILIAAAFGAGILAKLADNVAYLSEITTELGVWVFCAALIALCSSGAARAAISVFGFFLAMLAGYYLATKLFFGFFPDMRVLLSWLFFALLFPLGAAAVWYGYGDKRYCVLLASLPIALLLLLGYPVYYAFSLSRALSVAFALVLFLLSARSVKQCAYIALCSAVYALLASRINIISLLFGGL